MSLKVKIKEYIDKKMTEEFYKLHGHGHLLEEISEEDTKALLYFIEFADEIHREYGSYFKWRKLLDKEGMKPYMYYPFKEEN